MANEMAHAVTSPKVNRAERNIKSSLVSLGTRAVRALFHPICGGLLRNGTEGSPLSLFGMKPSGSRFQQLMKRTVAISSVMANLLAVAAIAQTLPNDRRMIPPRSIQLTAQQDHIIRENVKDLHVESVG